VNPSHREHDELLVVRAATAETDAVDATLAERQLASCADCRALLADIQAVHASTAATVLRVPPRPRSFRIPAHELDRLAAPAWRRWLGRLGTPRFDLLRPLATAVAGLGLVVMVVGTAAPLSVPSTAEFGKAATTPPAAQGLGAPTPMPPTPTAAEGRQDSAYPPVASPTAPGSTPAAAGNGSTSSGKPAGPETGRGVDTAAPAPPAVPPATLAGGLAALAGALLLVLHTAARRLAGR
jgi:hypothetical protein